MTQQNGHENGDTIETAGEIFNDTAIELVGNPAGPEGLKLVRYRRGVSEVKPQVSHAGRMYAPVHLDPSLANCVRFPTRIAPPETTQELFAAVHDLLSSRLFQLDGCITAIVCAIFSSWFGRVLPSAPILWIVAPPGSPKNLTLRLLNVLCRRPICLVGVRRGDLPRVPMSVQPTLLLDEPDLQPTMQAILQASGHRGAHIASGHGVLEIFGPKIIFSQKIPSGTALESNVLRTALIPVSGQLSHLEKRAEAEIAEEFQARFLGYFLRNFDRVQIPKFDAKQLTLPVQEIALALGAAFVGDEKLQAKLPQLLAAQDEEIRADLASGFDSVVVEGTLSFIHQNGALTVRAGTAAKRISALFKGRGFQRDVSPENVGWAWKRLGIPSGRIDSAGNGIELTESTCRLVHQLAVSYGVRAVQSGPRDNCRLCGELQPKIVEAKAKAGSG